MVEMRNIVVITFDSLRADHCSFMGYHRETTPTLDRMARRGLYFENAVAASIATAPSMFTALTGEFPSLESSNYNPKDWRKEISIKKTISEVLLKKGYFTIAFSPNIAFSSYFGFSKGFKHFDDFSTHRKFRHYEKLRKISLTKFIRFFIYLYDFIGSKGGATPWEDIYDYILNKVRQIKEPCLIWILLLDTHIPYAPPKTHRKWSNYFSIIYSNYLAHRGHPAHIEKILCKMINIENAYDDCIYYADNFIKKFIEDLDYLDPIYIIHGDHGEGFGEHGFYGHPPGYPVVLYEEFIHIPLVIYNADIKGKVKKPISLKYLPSIIQDLVNTGSTTSDKGSEWVVSKVFDRGRIKIAVRMKDWKFITGQKEEDELYYLKKDPYEQENLIDDYPDLVKEMKKIVEKHIKHEMEKKKIREGLSTLKRRVK